MKKIENYLLATIHVVLSIYLIIQMKQQVSNYKTFTNFVFLEKFLEIIAKEINVTSSLFLWKFE